MADMEEAIQTTVRGLDGKMKSAYFDTKGNAILNPEDYYISEYDNANYWDLDTATVGDVTAAEKTKQIPDQANRAELIERRGGNDAAGTISDGYDPNASNNFGYTPDNVVSKYASKVPGPVGTFGRMAKTAQNISNLGSKNLARQSLGLDPKKSNSDIAKAALKGADDIADVQIGDKKYSVGFTALDKQTNATNLTPQEAIDRARRQGYSIKEIDKRQQKIDDTKVAPTKTKGVVTAALEKMGIKSPQLGTKVAKAKEALMPNKKEESIPTPTTKPSVEAKPNKNLTSPIEKATGIEKGWAKRALDKMVGKTPTAKKEEKKEVEVTVPTPTPRETVSTTPERAKELTQKQGEEETTTGTGFGFAGSGVSKPSTTDPLGRMSLAEVDIDKLGLQPDVAARFKDFQKAAVAQGLDLMVDTANAVRTPEQQAEIQKAGFSKTKNSYHNVGFALDVTPRDIQTAAPFGILDTKALEKSRELAKEFGFGLLDPSWDPGHMQMDKLGSAKSLAGRTRDAFGRIELSPEESLNVRDNSVPTPFSPDDMQANPTGLDITDIGLNTPLGPSFAEEREIDKSLSQPSALTDLTKNAEESMASLAPSVQDRIKSIESFSSLSPAQAAALGLANRTEEDIDAIAETLAGELGPESLRSLDQPETRTEIANMVASIENRAASKQFGTLSTALTPSQYNSLSPANMATTQNNFSKFGTALRATVADFYTGKLSPTSPTITSYANLDISNPSWAGKMKDVAKVGPHTFGTLTEDISPNLGYSQSFKDKMAALDKAKAATGAVATSANALSNATQTASNTTQVSPAQTAPTSDAGRGTTSDRQNQTGSTKDGTGASTSEKSGTSSDRGGNGGVGSGLGGSNGSTTSGNGFGSGSLGSSSVGGATKSTATASSSSRNGFGSSPTNNDDGGAKSPGGGF